MDVTNITEHKRTVGQNEFEVYLPDNDKERTASVGTRQCSLHGNATNIDEYQYNGCRAFLVREADTAMCDRDINNPFQQTPDVPPV